MSYTINHHIQCCRFCVPPKRHRACHGSCPEYIKEKAEHDAEKAEVDKIKAIKAGLDAQAISGVDRAKKRRKGNY